MSKYYRDKNGNQKLNSKVGDRPDVGHEGQVYNKVAKKILMNISKEVVNSD